MFGTLINPDPLDIQGATEVIGSAERDVEICLDYTLSSESIKATKRATDKH